MEREHAEKQFCEQSEVIEGIPTFPTTLLPKEEKYSYLIKDDVEQEIKRKCHGYAV